MVDKSSFEVVSILKDWYIIEITGKAAVFIVMKFVAFLITLKVIWKS